jgi:acyl carrier protein
MDMAQQKTRHFLPIGKPIANSTVYIADKYGYLQPVGVPGELIVGGDGVARGYLNNPELTAEKFLSVSYRTHRSYISKRIYKTGDLARWLTDGNIEFLGRIDQQVKIRGFRLELGEIESVLQTIEGIKESVVIVREDNTGQKYLCGYIVSDEEKDLREIKNSLSRILPAYMIPAYFLQLDKMPLTPNGKIDRKVLPIPELKLEETYVPPGNEREEKMVEIWSEILGIEKEVIGIHDNFFECGGNSLKLTILAAKVHEVFNVDLPLEEAFQTPTVKGICDLISVTGWVKNLEARDNQGKRKETIL